MKRVKVAKLSRSLGVVLTAKAGRFMEKRPYAPGQHGKGKRPTQSTFGKQLLEKQRLKAQYNVSEKQLRNYFDKAQRMKGSSGTNLLRLLESRLDMTVHRSGFAPTIYAARQMVSHGHIAVNGKRITKAGFQVKVGAIVTPTEKAMKHPLINSTLAGAVIPAFISSDKGSMKASISYLPERTEIPVMCDEQLVVEFYSR